MSIWVPLRTHTDLSFLRSFGKSKHIATRCSELKYQACAITDIDSVSACVDFYKSCKEKEIKPILGCEFSNKFTVVCKNRDGWTKLIQSISEIENIDEDMFSEGNHVIISGYYGSSLASAILSEEAYMAESYEHAKSFLREDWEYLANGYINSMQTSTDNNFYIAIELLDKNFYAAQVLTECFRKIASENNNCRLVASNDCRYSKPEEAEYHNILLCSYHKTTLPDIRKKIQSHIRFDDRHFFLSNTYCIPSDLSPYADKEIANAKEIADSCEDYNILSSPALPSFDCPNGMTEIEYLKELCRKGWKEILTREQQKSETYIKRIRDEELPVIEEANLSGYFLIVQDIINYVRSRGWLPGPGRGSAAGCLISYLIRITQVDPIPFNLLFSRFYNASRKGSLPDIDIDVPAEHRDEIIAYIKSKYGHDKVCQMATFGRLQGRSAIKEVMRIEGGVSFAEMNEITKYIPDEARIADELEEMENKSIILWALMNNSKELSKWCSLAEDGTLFGDYAEIFRKAIKIEGSYKSQGKHAAGVVIASQPLKNLCPMVKDKDGNLIAGFEMSDLEAISLVKFDILGVDILSKVMKVSKDKNLNINDFFDASVWEDILCEGDTQGVFQLESQLGKSWAKRVKPKSIEELSDLIAIIRPGCLESYIDGKSLTWHYVNRKNKVDPVTYLHPALEPVLKNTYGILVYQEQSMMIARDIAGFTEQEADSLRKAIGKKLPELMAKLKVDFLNGCKKVGTVNEQEAAQIFDWIEASQRYSFNKSHSVCYAINGFWSAYCKKYNLDKFYEVYLNHSERKQDSQEEIRLLVADAKLHGVDVLPPSLSHFYLDFTITAPSQIHFGVSHIKDVGKTECQKITSILDQDISKLSWIEILASFGSTLNRRACIGLISTGALCGVNNRTPRNKMLYEYDSWKGLSDREREYITGNIVVGKELADHVDSVINNLKIQSNRLQQVLGVKKCLINPTSSLIDEIGWVADIEKKYFGVSLTFSKSDSVDSNIVNASCKDVYNNAVRHSTAVMAVSINSIREWKGKNGQQMAFLSVEDSSATLDSVVIFSEAYELYKDVLYEGNTVIIMGKPSKKKDGSLIVEKVCQV